MSKSGLYGEKMRLFLAIQFEKQILDALTGFQRELRKIGAVGNYTREENLHLTLAFIGEYGAPEAVLDAMEQVAFRPFDLRLDGMGSFGDLLWVGISAEEELSAVVRRLRHELSDSGIPFDRKKFQPHITLIRTVRYKSDQRLPLEHLYTEAMTVKRISLMKSERGRNGMVYTEIGYIEAD